MSIRLVILGVLNDGPKHGYEIKHIIEDHMGDWTNIAFGSIYFALKKLTEEGLLNKIAEEKEGNRPARLIYEITEEGRKEFDELLKKAWINVERNYFEFDVALFFIGFVKKEKVMEYVDKRIEVLGKELEGLKKHYSYHKENTKVPAIAFEIMNHTLEHQKAELKWLVSLKEKMQKLL